MPPFAVLRDLRWAGVYKRSAPAAILLAALIVAARTLFFAAVLLVTGVGPTQTPPPALLRRSAIFGVVIGVCLWPSVALLVGMAVFPLICFLFVALPTAFVIGVLLCPYLLTGRWRQWPSWRQIGLQVLSFALLSLAGGCIAALPGGAQYGIAIAVGFFSTWIWTRLIADAEVRNHQQSSLHAWLPGLATYVAAGLLLAWIGGFMMKMERTPEAQHPTALGHPVLWVPGFDSEWAGGAPSPFGHDGTRFSYRGISADGQPLYYSRADTQQSIFVLAGLMKHQVDHLHAASRATVDIIADSEGAFVAQTYLLVNPDAPVHRVVLSSPLLRSARAYYPARGASGRGAIAGATLGGGLHLFALVSSIGLNRDLPFFRSVVDHAPLMRDYLGCHAPSATTEVILLPISATAGEPVGMTTENPVFIEVTFHGEFVRSQSGVAMMARLLSGQGLEHKTTWRVIGWFGRALGSAWEAPPLSLQSVDVWRADVERVKAGDASRLSCMQMQRLAHLLVASAGERN